MISELAAAAKSSVDPDLVESMKIVLGGAYGGLALRTTVRNDVPISILLGLPIIGLTYLLVKLLNYIRHDQVNREDEREFTTNRTVGKIQLRSEGTDREI